MPEDPEGTRGAATGAGPQSGTTGASQVSAGQGVQGGGQAAPQGTAAQPKQAEGWDWNVSGPEFQRRYQEATEQLSAREKELANWQALGESPDEVSQRLEGNAAQTDQAARQGGQATTDVQDPFNKVYRDAVEMYLAQVEAEYGRAGMLAEARRLGVLGEQRGQADAQTQQTPGLSAEQIQQMIDERVANTVWDIDTKSEAFDDALDHLEARFEPFAKGWMKQEIEVVTDDGNKIKLPRERAVRRMARANPGLSPKQIIQHIDERGYEQLVGMEYLANYAAAQQEASQGQQVPGQFQVPGFPQEVPGRVGPHGIHAEQLDGEVGRMVGVQTQRPDFGGSK